VAPMESIVSCGRYVTNFVQPCGWEYNLLKNSVPPRSLQLGAASKW
jgi:hypothetical protein